VDLFESLPATTDTIVDGLPVATGEDGADPEVIEIIAMGLAFNGEISESSDPGTLRALAMVRYGDQSEESLAKAGRGTGMLVEYRNGPGVVVHAGSTEWVMGLRAVNGDADAVTVTRNILNHAIARAPAAKM
jgi:hypothetical protein